MKMNVRNTIAYSLLALAAVSTSCTSDDIIDATAGNRTVQNVAIEDAGFAGSRAEEVDYTTVFTPGDQVGIFAVKDGAIAEGVDNVCLSAVAGEDGKVVWQPATGTLPMVEGATYYAYYPYTATLPAAVDVTAGDHTLFFASIADAWNVASDQSNYADYTASDFMTASAQVDERGALHFVLSHRMALAIVNFPTTRYVFTNEPAIPDYVIMSATSVQFDGVQLLEKKKSATFAYILNPAGEKITISGSYGEAPTERQWSFSPAMKAGTVNVYNIDRKLGKGEVKHHLQLGDFFLSDGTLLSKDAPKEEVRNADVVGIVCNINPDRIGADEKAALGGVAHATVLSVFDAKYNANKMLSWSNTKRDETAIGFKLVCGETGEESVALADEEISGLHNTNLIRNKRPAAFATGEYEAFLAAVEMGKDKSNYSQLASLTTGWYLPTLAQWLDVARNLGGFNDDTSSSDHFQYTMPDLFYWYDNVGTPRSNVNKYFEKIAITFYDPIERNHWIWTSTISGYDYAYAVNITDGELMGKNYLNTVSCFGEPKTGFYHVRPMLTF